MFGREIKIGNKSYFVFCCPDTPYSELLVQAARMAEREEIEAHNRDPNVKAYRDIMKAQMESLT